MASKQADAQKNKVCVHIQNTINISSEMWQMFGNNTNKSKLQTQRKADYNQGMFSTIQFRIFCLAIFNN